MSSTRIDVRSIVVGWMFVGAIAAALALAAVGTALGATLYPVPVAIAFLLAALHAAAVPLALRMPRTAGALSVVVVTALAVVQSPVVGAPWPWAVTTMVAQSIVVGLIGFQARSRVGVLVWLASVAGTVGASALYPTGTDAPTVNIIIAGSVTAVALAGGIVAREWRSIRAQLISERAVSAEEHEGRVLAEEKTRIARELHDVVAHSMSIIAVQATSAPYRHESVPAPVAREFEEIAEAARTAMQELRGVLSVLRQGDAEPDLAPQPTLADLPALIEHASRSGVDIVLDDDSGTTTSVSSGAALAAYRVVQEAISNAMRHAPGASIRVSCTIDRATLVVSVVNSASIGLFEPSEGGHGLLGMRERVRGVGGHLSVGPTDEGGYSVVARIPVRSTR